MPASGNIADFLDLTLAWERVKLDLKSGRVFIKHPHEKALIEENTGAWIKQLETDLRNGTYAPSAMILVNVPKPKGGIRPGGLLSIRDQVIYAALVGSMLSRIRSALTWSNDPVDFSYPLADDLTKTDWLKPSFNLWRAFANKSVERIDKGSEFVLMADIAGYYELVDFEVLMSDLRALGIEDILCKQLSACLNRWSLAAASGRGLPQGFRASDILGRLYLNQVDQALHERGFTHYRYVDDYRIFTNTEREGLIAFAELIVLLRKRGLVIQSQKSELLPGAKARGIILGIQPILKSILKDFIDDVGLAFDITNPYFDFWEAQQLLESNPERAPVDIIRAAYQKYFIDTDPSKFDKTLFHFLLKRLCSFHDKFAFPHVFEVLAIHPEETQAVLDYVGDVSTAQESDPYLLSIIDSDRAVYPYQLYQIVQWRNTLLVDPSIDLLSYIRKIIFERPIPLYLRSVCREFLAKWGSPADLERLIEGLQAASSDIEKAELICCLRRIEIGRRNSIISRVASEGEFPSRAARLVRANRL